MEVKSLNGTAHESSLSRQPPKTHIVNERQMPRLSVDIPLAREGKSSGQGQPMSCPITKTDKYSAITLTRKIAEDLRNNIIHQDSLTSSRTKINSTSPVAETARKVESLFAPNFATGNISSTHLNVTNGTLFSSQSNSQGSLRVSVGGSGTNGGKKKSRSSPQLLHQRLNQIRLKETPTSESINNFVLDDMILQSNIPQWLVHSWLSKVKDKSMRDKKTQMAIADLLILKQYALPAALCATLSANQHEQAAKIIITVFRDLHLVFKRNRCLSNEMTRGKKNRSPVYGSSGDEDSGDLVSNSLGVQRLLGTPDTPSNRNSEIIVPASPGSGKVPSVPATKRRDHLLGFLNVVISEEVTEAKSEATLFRGNNIASKLLTLYASQPVKDYLCAVLTPALKKVINMGSLEVDPTKLAAKVSTPSSEQHPQPQSENILQQNVKEIAAQNMLKLLEATKQVLDAILLSVSDVPVELRKVCYLIQCHAERKFGLNSVPGTPVSSSFPASATTQSPLSHSVTLSAAAAALSTDEATSTVATTTRTHQVAVSGFIFLRFICPLIVTPDGFLPGLDATQRRSLVLISKVLQNIANGVKFGSKEAYMAGANSFLEHYEKEVVRFCHEIQPVREDNIFLVDEDENNGSEVAEFDNSLQQMMGLFNLQMDKILGKIENVIINESLTYSVFGALKPIMKNFDSVEKSLQLNGSDEANVDGTQMFQLNKRDSELMNNLMLLGGLEEILLMNRCVLLRGLLNAENFSSGRTFTQITNATSSATANDQEGGVGNDVSQKNNLMFREMEIIAKSVTNLVAPHGISKLFDILEWTIEQEFKLFSTKYHQLTRQQYFKDLIFFCGNNCSEERGERSRIYEKSIAKRLLFYFLAAHSREILRPAIGNTLIEIQQNLQNYEIDPTIETSEEKLKNNFEILLNVAVKIFDQIVATKTIPDSFRRVLTFLLQNMKSFETITPQKPKENTGEPEYDEENVDDLNDLIFNRFIFNAIGSPVQYGIINESENQRLLTTISFLLKFLAREDSGEQDEEMLQSVRDHFHQSMNNFIRTQIVSPALQQPQLPQVPESTNTPLVGMLSQQQQQQRQRRDTTGSEVSLVSTKSKVSVSDQPIYIPAVSRARAVLYHRKLLTPYAIRKLKSMINTSEISNNNKLDLNGIRMETVHYRLGDRVRCVFWKLYGNHAQGRGSNTSFGSLGGNVQAISTDKQRHASFVSGVPLSPSPISKEMKYGTIRSENTADTTAIIGSVSSVTMKKERKWFTSGTISSYKKLIKSIFGGGKTTNESPANSSLEQLDEMSTVVRSSTASEEKSIRWKKRSSKKNK